MGEGQSQNARLNLNTYHLVQGPLFWEWPHPSALIASSEFMAFMGV